MSCRVTDSSVHNHEQPQVLGTPSCKPARWSVQIRVAIPAGIVVHHSIRILTNVTVNSIE